MLSTNLATALSTTTAVTPDAIELTTSAMASENKVRD
uniref:Uncharacterized protein n=1 Tax=Arundo donax TaxID=35708 RepID=A0A0A8ZBS1_ARUDO